MRNAGKSASTRRAAARAALPVAPRATAPVEPAAPATFAGDAVRDKGDLRSGKRASVTFARPGTSAYVCEFHPTMTGTVVVQ